MRDGGRNTVPVDMTVAFPILMAVLEDFAEGSEGLGARGRVISPRKCTSAISTVRPASVMFGVPAMRARRETLLPES